MTDMNRRPSLFDTARLGRLELPNRLVMAPMSRNRATSDGVPTPMMAEYYAQRASAGLIVAEASTPAQVGFTYPGIPGIFNDAQAAGWRRVAEKVAAAGGRIFLQLEHGGRIGHPDNGGLVPMAPSPIALPGGIHTPNGHRDAPVPREMTEADIRSTVKAFVAAARNAVRAGADGVEVHSANGYLLNQFLATSTNHRTDAYGGSIENRVRFPVEVVEAVASAIGPERVGLRISPGNPDNGMAMDDADRLFPALLDAVAPAGIAYLHLVYADAADPLFTVLRDRWETALIANPVLGRDLPLPADGGRSRAEALLEAGADLIALGRPFLANPDLVERFRTGAPINPVREDVSMYGGDETGYLDYPTISGRTRSGRAAVGG